MADVPIPYIPAHRAGHPILHDAWVNQGQWLQATRHLKAKLEWQEDIGWVLDFENSRVEPTLFKTMVLCTVRDLHGQSWPNSWSLQDLYYLDHTWQDHIRVRRRARRLTRAVKYRGRPRWQSGWLC